MDCNMVYDARNYSEWKNGIAKNSNLFRIFKECLIESEKISDDKELFEKIVSKLNEYFSGENKITFKGDTKVISKICSMLDEQNQDISKIDIGNSTMDVNEELKPLKEILKELTSKGIYDENCIENYLKAFKKFSQDIIFNPENAYIRKVEKSRLIKNISTLGIIPFESKALAEQGYLYYSIYSPYVASKIRNIATEIVNSSKKLSNSSELKELKYQMFLEKVHSYFSRFSVYNNKIYKTDYNCSRDEIVSIPLENVSSMNRIKPIYLFEKIASYIIRALERTRKVENSILSIKILIIGHTEMTISENGAKEQRELSDLLEAIICWYNRISKKNDPKLNCIITNIVSEGDIFQESGIIKTSKNGNEGVVYIKPYDFMNFYYAFNSSVTQLLDENDLSFFLDCPFFTLVGNGHKTDEFKFYCKELSKLKLEDAISKLEKLYNDLMTFNNSQEALNIDYRPVYHHTLERIQNFVKEKTDLDRIKEVYVFFTSQRGIDYSFLGTYPFVQEELYNGTLFKVACFTNEEKIALTCSNELIVNFKIRLWSLFKYISVSYLFKNISDVIDRVFGNYIKSTENYFEICRDVIIDIEVDNSSKYITFSLKFSDGLDKLAMELGIPNNQLNSMKELLYNEFVGFLKVLIEDEVFSSKDSFESNIIKDAFKMCLYDSVNNANAMFFFDLFREAREKKTLNKFAEKIKWMEHNIEMETIIDDNYHLILNDKIIYRSYIERFKISSELTMGQRALAIYFEDEVANESGTDFLISILSNIKSVCENLGDTDSELYENTLEALEQY